MYFAARFGGQPDSDVEILSNPSISSIEVLDQFSRHSSRKQSEDRRYGNQMHQYALMQQPQHGVLGGAGDDNRSTDWQSSSSIRDIDSNVTTTTSSSDVEELGDDESLAILMHRQTSTDDLDNDETTVATEAIVHDDTNGSRNGKVLRKPLLTGMNLTESSSSGSVTDSICTAYEQQQTATTTTDAATKGVTRESNGSGDVIPKTTSSVPSMTASTTMTTNTTTTNPTTAIADNTKPNNNTVNESDDKTKTNEISTLSTMIGGEYTLLWPNKNKNRFYSASTFPHKHPIQIF